MQKNTLSRVAKIVAKEDIHGRQHHRALQAKGAIDVRTLKMIPRFFNGRAFNYDGAVGELIRKEIREKGVVQ